VNTDQSRLKPLRKSQFEIKTSHLESDKDKVEAILLAAANFFELFDNTHTSKVPETIRSIVEGDGFGFGLGARVKNNSIFVDFNRPKNLSPKFDEVKQFIVTEMKSAFARELPEIWEDDPTYRKTQ
jgi:hypothetical protein